MGRTADVNSFEAVRGVGVALRNFEHDARQALAELDSEIGRFGDWLDHDQAHYWRQQVRRGWEHVAQCRADLERCRAVTVAGHRSSCREERLALERAQRRVRHAEEKVNAVRTWHRKFQQELHEFHGRIQALAGWLDIDLPRAVTSIHRMQAALESYARLEAPSAPDVVAPEAASNAPEAESSPTPTPHEPDDAAMSDDESNDAPPEK